MLPWSGWPEIASDDGTALAGAKMSDRSWGVFFCSGRSIGTSAVVWASFTASWGGLLAGCGSWAGMEAIRTNTTNSPAAEKLVVRPTRLNMVKRSSNPPHFERTGERGNLCAASTISRRQHMAAFGLIPTTQLRTFAARMGSRRDSHRVVESARNGYAGDGPRHSRRGVW